MTLMSAMTTLSDYHVALDTRPPSSLSKKQFGEALFAWPSPNAQGTDAYRGHGEHSLTLGDPSAWVIRIWLGSISSEQQSDRLVQRLAGDYDALEAIERGSQATPSDLNQHFASIVLALNAAESLSTEELGALNRFVGGSSTSVGPDLDMQTLYNWTE
jgi:hypothetical protein